MREHKFRVWDKEKKEMIYINNIWIDFAKLGQEHIDNKRNLHVLIIMDYIGFCDKNNKEIYEGDIAKQCCWTDWVTATNRHWKKGRVIIWDEDNCKFNFRNEDGEIGIWNFYSDVGYKVIGNIYENPELLKEVE